MQIWEIVVSTVTFIIDDVYIYSIWGEGSGRVRGWEEREREKKKSYFRRSAARLRERDTKTETTKGKNLTLVAGRGEGFSGGRQN